MKYISLELDRYAPFKTVAKINRLTLVYTSDVQVIIGTNGSGKSSLLRETSPLPATSSDYDAGGAKKLVLEHQGNEYILVSDFTNKGSPHSFRRNGVELNEGHTTQVQKELVRTHLGFSPLIESITTMQESFSTMAAGARKTLLMMLNPCNMEYAFEQHKKISSKVRAHKSTLAHLQERKAALSAELLDESLVAQLHQESEEINQTVAVVVESLYRIDERLRGLELPRHSLSVTQLIDQAKALTKKVKAMAPGFHEVPRTGDPQAVRDALVQEISATKARIEMLSGHAGDLTTDINSYAEKLATLASEEGAAETLAEITRLKEEIAKLEASGLTTTAFNRAFMTDIPDILEKIRELCIHFVGCDVKLVASAVITRWRGQLHQRQAELRVVDQEIGRLSTLLATLEKRLPIRLEDLPQTNCGKMMCPLYVRFRSIHDDTADQLDETRRKLAHLTHKKSRLAPYVIGMQQRMTELNRYLPQLYQLSELLQQYSYLRPPLQELDFLVTLQANPITIYERIRSHFEKSYAFYLHQDLQDELGRKIAASEAAVNTDERKMLEGLLTTSRARLEGLRQEIVRHHQELNGLAAKLETHDGYWSALHGLKAQMAALESRLALEAKATDGEILKAFRDILDDYRRTAVGRLGTIDRTLREQQKVEARLSEEVVTQMALLEAELARLLLVEEALAGIPHNAMCDFINALFATMNFYIRQVFTYTYEIQPVNPDSPLDYRFPVKVVDHTVKDLAMCSSAQKEIVDLVFMLAVIRHLGLSDYPIHLDEIGKSFDPNHKHRLLNLLRHLTESKSISQMFLINHHAEVHDGLANAEILVLNPNNIVTPAVYNTHADIER